MRINIKKYIWSSIMYLPHRNLLTECIYYTTLRLQSQGTSSQPPAFASVIPHQSPPPSLSRIWTNPETPVSRTLSVTCAVNSKRCVHFLVNASLRSFAFTFVLLKSHLQHLSTVIMLYLQIQWVICPKIEV